MTRFTKLLVFELKLSEAIGKGFNDGFGRLVFVLKEIVLVLTSTSLGFWLELCKTTAALGD